jgi:hypothetical protein
MRRNWELIRRILSKLEEQETARGELMPDAIAGYDEELTAYHFMLLDQAGLIEARGLPAAGPKPRPYVAMALTWEGHELLDHIRSETVWNGVKRTAREKGLELSFEVVKQAAIAIIKATI